MISSLFTKKLLHRSSMKISSLPLLFVFPFSTMAFSQVVVETISPSSGAPVTKEHTYSSMVTLYIEENDKSRTPSGWSTRKEDGAAADSPFQFQPGVNLIQGWTQGVLQMKEGERALLHIPAHLGYGRSPMGSPGGAFYIPANSNLLFDIEVLGKAGSEF